MKWGELFCELQAEPESHLLSARQEKSQNTFDKMLNIIGLGLADEKDISVKGLEIVKKAERVYLEAYTAVLLVDQSVLVRQHLNTKQVEPERHSLHTIPMQ